MDEGGREKRMNEGRVARPRERESRRSPYKNNSLWNSQATHVMARGCCQILASLHDIWSAIVALGYGPSVLSQILITATILLWPWNLEITHLATGEHSAAGGNGGVQRLLLQP